MRSSHASSAAPSCTPWSMLAVLEALATGDPRPPGVVMTSTTSTLLAPYLARDRRADLARRHAVHRGRVRAERQGLRDGRLSGRWSYASGCRHAEWFALGAIATASTWSRWCPRASVDDRRQLGHARARAAPAATTSRSTTRRRRATSRRCSAARRGPTARSTACRCSACSRSASPRARVGIARLALGSRCQAELAQPRSSRPSGTRAGRARCLARVRRRGIAPISSPPSTRRRPQSRDARRAPTRGDPRRERGGRGRARAVPRRRRRPRSAPVTRSSSALRDVETALTHRMVGRSRRAAAARAMLGLGSHHRIYESGQRPAAPLPGSPPPAGWPRLLPPDARLVDDPYGERVRERRGSPQRSSVERARLGQSPASPWILYMQVRTRVIDDAVRAFVAAGGRQLVLLGAGYDCRALRLAELARHRGVRDRSPGDSGAQARGARATRRRARPRATSRGTSRRARSPSCPPRWRPPATIARAPDADDLGRRDDVPDRARDRRVAARDPHVERRPAASSR